MARVVKVEAIDARTGDDIGEGEGGGKGEHDNVMHLQRLYTGHHFGKGGGGGGGGSGGMVVEGGEEGREGRGKTMRKAKRRCGEKREREKKNGEKNAKRR